MDLIQQENIVFEDFDYIQFMIEQAEDKEFMVIGGQQTYELFLPYADRMYLTYIYHDFEKVDTFFPSYDMSEWNLKDSRFYNKDENNDYSFSILTLERKGV
ncbi:dihydrofolate reductase [Priestia megaterium]